MVRYCAAPNCKELYDKDSIIKLHKFPVDSDRRNKWMQAMKVDNFVLKKFASLCSKHFEEKCFLIVHNRRMLRRDAIPSIFIDPPSAMPSSSGLPSISSLRDILNKKIITAVPKASAVSSKSTAENLCFEDQSSDSVSSTSPPISAIYLTKRKTDRNDGDNNPRRKRKGAVDVDSSTSEPKLKKSNKISNRTAPIEEVLIKTEHTDEPIEEVFINHEHINEPVVEITVKEELIDEPVKEIVIKEECLDDYPHYSQEYKQIQIKIKTEEDEENYQAGDQSS